MLIQKPQDVGSPAPTPRSSAAAAGSRTAAVVPGQPVASGEERVELAAASDQVQLSDASRAMIAANQGSPDVRGDKVAAIKKAIEEGTYHAHAQKIADQLIKEASELLESLSGKR